MKIHILFAFVACAVFCLVAINEVHAVGRGEILVTDYPSIQAAVDANPGRMIHVPAGEYRIEKSIDIRTSDTGLYGYGTIIQTNPDAPIIRIRNTEETRLEDLTLTRSEGARKTHRDGVLVFQGQRFQLMNLHIIDNHSDNAAIRIHQGHDGRVEGCEIINYKRIGVEDRTANPLYGFAFRSIIGDGIVVNPGTQIRIAHNIIIEKRIDSGEEAKEQFKLGQLTEGRAPTQRGKLAPPGDYVPNWHQGSAITVGSPDQTSHVLITDNLIENAGQGVDIQADHVTFSNNIIHTAVVGIKCMHGSRNVVIANNNVSYMDLWGLVMLPGTAARRAENGRPPNVTRGNVIANNIFSDFGFGRDYHVWKSSDMRSVLYFEASPEGAPPLSDVIIQGNLVYDPSRDGSVADGNPAGDGPRYLYAVTIDPQLDLKSFQFSGNIFHPGTRGVSNVDWKAR